MRENRTYGSMRGGGAKPELTITVSLIRRYHPAYSTKTCLYLLGSTNMSRLRRWDGGFTSLYPAEFYALFKGHSVCDRLGALALQSA